MLKRELLGCKNSPDPTLIQNKKEHIYNFIALFIRCLENISLTLELYRDKIISKLLNILLKYLTKDENLLYVR